MRAERSAALIPDGRRVRLTTMRCRLPVSQYPASVEVFPRPADNVTLEGERNAPSPGHVSDCEGPAGEAASSPAGA